MSQYQLAQLNVAVMKEPLTSPIMVDFVANLDRINALAESSPGFLWRLKGDGADATSLRPMGEDTIVNMSVWRDVASLHQYVYRSGHIEVMRRRKEWFERMAEAYAVLWWVRKGHYPTVIEAIERLDYLLRKNALRQRRSPFAAHFRHPNSRRNPHSSSAMSVRRPDIVDSLPRDERQCQHGRSFARMEHGHLWRRRDLGRGAFIGKIQRQTDSMTFLEHVRDRI